MALLVSIWSFTATIEAVTLRGLTPLQFSAWSTCTGALASLLYLILTGRGISLLNYRRKDYLRLAILSILGFSGYQLLKFNAYVLVPIPQANILQNTYPIFIVIFALPFLGQPITSSKIIGISLGFLGAAIILSGGKLFALDWANLDGYLLALCAGISWALFSVLTARKSFDPVSSMFFMQLFGSILMFGILISGGMFTVPSSLPTIGGALYSGVFSNVIGVLLWLAAQRSTKDVSQITGFLYLVPFLSLIALRVFLGFPVSGSAYLGLVCIVGGASYHHIQSRKKSGKVFVKR
jgi:drug/metabolite transporter (DMT)-like permease